MPSLLGLSPQGVDSTQNQQSLLLNALKACRFRERVRSRQGAWGPGCGAFGNGCEPRGRRFTGANHRRKKSPGRRMAGASRAGKQVAGQALERRQWVAYANAKRETDEPSGRWIAHASRDAEVILLAPTGPGAVEAVLTVSRVREKTRPFSLGSGDGRWLLQR